MLAAVRALVEQQPVAEDYSKFEYVLVIHINCQCNMTREFSTRHYSLSIHVNSSKERFLIVSRCFSFIMLFA